MVQMRRPRHRGGTSRKERKKAEQAATEARATATRAAREAESEAREAKGEVSTRARTPSPPKERKGGRCSVM